MRTLADINKMALNEPNDQALGEKVRQFLNNEDPKHFRICVKCGRWQSDLNGKCKFCGATLNNWMNHED